VTALAFERAFSRRRSLAAVVTAGWMIITLTRRRLREQALDAS
jgi:hypothetical protein